jgi:hypothetical protein
MYFLTLSLLSRVRPITVSVLVTLIIFYGETEFLKFENRLNSREVKATSAQSARPTRVPGKSPVNTLSCWDLKEISRQLKLKSFYLFLTVTVCDSYYRTY